MAKSNRHYIFEGLEILPEAMFNFVEKWFESTFSSDWQIEITDRIRGLNVTSGRLNWDQASLVNAINLFWDDAFKSVLGRGERAIVSELIDVRNKLAHNEAFSCGDAECALDSMRRLLEAIGSAPAAEKLSKMRNAILRIKFNQLRRNEERRKTSNRGISVKTIGGLLPWREIVEPHLGKISAYPRCFAPYGAGNT